MAQCKEGSCALDYGGPCRCNPSHPFTPDVVAWARDTADREALRGCRGLLGPYNDSRIMRAARQILAAVGEG